MKKADLRGERCELRTLSAVDPARLYDLDVGGDRSLDYRFRGATPSVEAYERALLDGVTAGFVACDPLDGGLAALFSFYALDAENRHGYLSITRLGPDDRLGVVREGSALFTEYCFRNWDLRKLYSEVLDVWRQEFDSCVTESWREEVRLVDEVFVDGRYVDKLVLSLPRREWQAARSRS